MKRTARVLLVIGVGISVGALTFETAIRLFVPVADVLWEWDPVVGAKLIPNKRGRWVKAGVFDVPVEVNSSGFRGREHSYEKPLATSRIVLLGDSFIEALQVPFERSITSLLEERLRKADIKAEIINPDRRISAT